MEKLPQELVDHIIDCLQNDKTALRACSTVASAWSDSARRYIFKNTNVMQRNVGAFRKCSAIPFRFTRILRSYLQELLHVSECTRFLNVTHLALYGLQLESSMDHTVLPFFKSFPNLTSLVLRSCRFPSLEIFIQAIHCLPALHHLELVTFGWGTVSAPPLEGYQYGPLPLRQLTLDRNGLPSFLARLLEIHPVLRLWYFKRSYNGPGERRGLAFRDSLRTIELECKEFEIPDIPQYPAVSTICMPQISDDGDQNFSPATIFNSITPKQHIRHFALWVYRSSWLSGALSAEPMSETWSAIDDGMSLPQFRDSTLVIGVNGLAEHENVEPLRETFAALLPNCAKRGALLVQQYGNAVKLLDIPGWR